ncbi:hypothetical protein BDV38DRAFT_239664 [Aspergillus pseudotamarii]|uniref:J domain-containing protein n=1 Tax=Aspergillus pseudotamarii TaxID=132259 RepID=A0A5N6T280_ASPPS|nr:uncharacterized protein BDV38DRAFT_239664 [Aspergillus pseudotamarii]KAE8140402.1 hypothetical protein BDV38DRAFT_239664 [Aspergillus pseudotamarii]
MSLDSDPYITLGVSEEAELPEIRSAYRRLISKYLPDKSQDELQLWFSFLKRYSSTY